MSTRRVLLIDDHQDTADAMSLMLGLNGYSVLTSGDAAHALRLATEHRPCLIVLDLTLPCEDGAVFRERQLADPALAEIPCVCVSGRHDAPEVARRLGINTCFVKPVNFADLLRAIAAHCTAVAEPA